MPAMTARPSSTRSSPTDAVRGRRPVPPARSIVPNPSHYIDRTARDLAAQSLRGLISGRLTNDDFEDFFPISRDPAIEAVWSTAWCLYSDMRSYALNGAHALHPATRREALRWLLFLDSDLPYMWPERSHPGMADPRDVHKQVSFFGGRARARRFFSAGDYAVWPFVSRSDYKRALRHPRRLGGRRRVPVSS